MRDSGRTVSLTDHVDSLAPVTEAETDTDERSSGSVDGASILDEVGTAAIVGLGEATHGTREFYGLRRRLLGRLIRTCGFRTIVLEADVVAAMALDDYVCHRTGDRRAAIDTLRKWLWKTESMAGLLADVRSFNEGRPPDDRVRVRGVDLSEPAVPAGPVGEYLRHVDPTYAESSESLATLSALSIPRDDGTARRRAITDAAHAVADITARLRDRRAEYVAASTTEAFERAERCCRVVEQTCEWHRVRHEQAGPHEDGMTERDRYMAENVAWCHERDTGAGVVVLAHNTHVQRGQFDDDQVWTDGTAMGQFLSDQFGDDYAPIATDFGRGSFRALPGDGVPGDGPRSFEVGEPLPETLTARFDDHLDGPAFLDFESVAEESSLAKLLSPAGRIRWVGSVYDPGADPDVNYQKTDLVTAYDGVGFVPESTPTRPL